ncbi:helix-turn-helix transcriptional regulator [Neomicrococcus lactis]|uniref:helix-turn-helix transcriptional regulator n=1 Tax=Neomicrococcus lactis TaxID=732241 RepID=UPI003A5C8057
MPAESRFPADELPVSTKEAARYLGLAPKTLAHWRSRGKGPRYLRFGVKSVSYLRADLAEFRNSHMVGSVKSSSRRPSY